MGTVIAIGNTNSGYALEKPQLTRISEGWDEVRELVRLSGGAGSLTLGGSRSPAGITGTFFIQSAREIGCQLGMKVVEIMSRGLASGKGYIAEPTAYTETADGSIEGMPGAPGGVVRGQVQVPRVGVNVRWLSTSDPSSGVVGSLLTPPETFGVPSYPFTPLDPYRLWHYPYGWYLAKRDSQRLPLTSYHMVFDYYINQPNPTMASGS